MKQLDYSKLHNSDAWLDERYGKPGTQSRIDHENKALAWYYGEILRDKRKELKITQNADFFNISQALGLKFALL